MDNIVITIARQIGSGGYTIAKKISETFGFKLIDRELVFKTAELLKTDVHYLDKKDEKVSSLLDTILSAFSFGAPEIGSLASAYYPTDEQIFSAQSHILQDFAKKSSIIALGRGSFYVFKDYPKHLSFFLKANIDYRVKNVAKEFNISTDKALELVKKVDRDRNEYIKKMTNINRCDLRNYDMIIDVSSLGLDLSINVILKVISQKFFAKGLNDGAQS